MNTLEDAKKVAWILGYLRAKLGAESQITIEMESVVLGSDLRQLILSETSLIIKRFNVSNLPLLVAEITYSVDDYIIKFYIIVTEKNIELNLIRFKGNDSIVSNVVNNVVNCISIEELRRDVLPMIYDLYVHQSPDEWYSILTKITKKK